MGLQVGADNDFDWHAPAPVAVAPSLTLIDPDGASTVVGALTPLFADITCTAIDALRERLTLDPAVDVELISAGAEGDAYLLVDGRALPVQIADLASDEALLAEPLQVALAVEGDGTTLQDAAATLTSTRFSVVIPAAAVPTDGVYTWRIVWTPVGAASPRVETGAIRALRRWSTGLAPAHVESLAPHIAIGLDRRDALAAYIEDAEQELLEWVRAARGDETDVISPAQFRPVANLLAQALAEVDLEVRRPYLRRQARERFESILASMFIDANGDGLADQEVATGRKTPRGGGGGFPATRTFSRGMGM